jgi:hypothetical protein
MNIACTDSDPMSSEANPMLRYSRNCGICRETLPSFRRSKSVSCFCFFDYHHTWDNDRQQVIASSIEIVLAVVTAD